MTGRGSGWHEYADGIPTGDGMMVEIGYLPHVIEAARHEGFVMADEGDTA